VGNLKGFTMASSFNLSCVTIRRALLLLAVLLVAGCGSPEQRAQNYYERGKQLLAQQDYVKAGIEFKNAVQLKKDLVEAWRGLYEVELHNRNFQSAIPILRTVVELDPKDVDTRLKLGHFLLAGNALDQALELANAAIALDGRNPNALALRAAVLLKLKDNIGSKRDAQAALDIDPKNVEALIVLAAERMGQGDTGGALLILDRPGLDHEDDLAIQLFKLRLFEQSKDFKQAEILLRKLVELHPQELAFRRSLIKLFVDQKRYDDAEKELRALAAANPSDIQAGLDVGRFLQQVKGPAAARQELVARIKAGEKVFQYQIALAEFDYAQGNVNDSIHLLESLTSNAGSPEDILAAQVKLAQIQFNQKKFDAAEVLDSAILRKDSRNIDGLKLRALIHMERGQLDAAIADLRQALEDQPRSSDLMDLLAAAYERSGSIELADKEYADATKIANFDVVASLNYVAFLRRRGNVERAEDVLTQSAQRSPNNVMVLTTLADVRLARQNWIGAQEIADTIKRIGDTRGLSDQILAAALNGQGKYGDSIKILEGLQASAPAAVQPMAALVSTLVRAQKLDQAVSLLQTALKANPANAEAHVLLGSVQLLKNAPDQAERSFKTAIERQPKEIVGYRALADFYVRNKNIDEAEKVIRTGLQQQPDSSAMHLTLAGVLEQKGDYDAAIAEYEYLLKQDPGSMIVANNLASLLSDHYTDKANLERAYSLAAVLRKSQIPSFKDTLGWLDYLRGDYKSATGLLEEAAAAMPNRALVQYHLGMSYVGSGQFSKASEQFKKALALTPDSALQQKIRAAQQKAAM
jgi:cellulose synthase operon protein C